MPIKQSVCYPILKPADMSFDAFCEALAEIGYPAVEAWGTGDFDELLPAARKHNLVVASCIGSGSCGGGFNDPDAHDELVAATKASVDLAADNGIPGLIVFSGNRRDGLTDEEGIDITAAGLAKAAPHAEKKGVNLNIELLNSKRDHAGYQCDHTAWAVAVCKKVGSPRVKILYDIYHMQIMEGDVIATIQENIDYIGHFHAAGNPGRTDFDDTQEMNYAGICQAISATDYDGYLGHEFVPKANALEALRTAFHICNVE